MGGEDVVVHGTQEGVGERKYILFGSKHFCLTDANIADLEPCLFGRRYLALATRQTHDA